MDSGSQQAADQDAHRVRPISPPVEVPVFNCLVLVAPRNAAGMVVARAANLAGLSAEGKTEREALQKLVASFKSTLTTCRESGQSISWIDPPVVPEPFEQQRWIAVHL